MTTTARTDLSLRRRTMLAAAIAAIGLGGATSALAGPDLVDLKVVDRETSQVMRVWRHDGRRFVAGQPGARYALRVTNHTGGRVLVVLSVDGINILSGETAGYDQRGYVFEAHETYDLTGWRKSDTEVAAFVFAPLPQSYAARTGRPGEVGVIGVAAFREKAVPVQAPPVEVYETRRNDMARRSSRAPYAPLPVVPSPAPMAAPPPPPSADSALMAKADRFSEADVTGSRIAPRDEKLGTGHGAREWSVTHTVPFERATYYPQTIKQLEYDTWDNLRAAGVIPTPDPQRHPRPFPTRPEGQGYVPDPPRED